VSSLSTGGIGKMTAKEIVVESINLKKHYPVMKGFIEGLFRRTEDKFVHAVDGLNLKIYKGETFGLVGESGCGKTTAGFLLLHLLSRTYGDIFFKGIDTEALDRKKYWQDSRKIFFNWIKRKETWDNTKTLLAERREKLKDFQETGLRRNLRKEMQIIFQNPYESLSPRFSVFDIVSEPLRLLRLYTDEVAIENRVIEELTKVGLVPAEDFLDRFPHELSGGQRQRVGVARAFVLDPDFVVADEPVSMLDVSVRVGVLRIMQSLTKERGTAFLFITHDLALARHMCDRIAVMYLGRIVEQGPTEQIIHNPYHPYTKALIAAVPKPDPDARRTEDLPIRGEVPSGIDIPKGCRFFDRCIYGANECMKIDPKLEDAGDEHLVACIRYKEINKLK
jgi:peptide/nickel transport system ATP-binding protein